MTIPNPSMAQQIAEAASAFEQLRTGHGPKSVTVVLSEETLVVTLHGALSPAEKALAQTPAGGVPGAGLSSPVIQRLGRPIAPGDQTNHRRRRSRSDSRSRDQDGYGRACVHDRYDGAGVSARPWHTRGHLERQWNSRSIMSMEHNDVGPVEKEHGIGRGRWVRPL